MAERIFCIDFGSAYTKVALRRDPTANCELLSCSGAEFDYWVPTVLAVDRRGSEQKIEFGDRAADLQAGGGIDVYHNFKSALFTSSQTSLAEPALSPLEAMFRSDEFVTLAAKYAVTVGQLTALRQLTGTAKALLGELGDRVASVEVKRQENAFKVACHFFRLLRQQVLDACAKLSVTGLKFEDIPVRIAVPAFPSRIEIAEHPGSKLLRDALQRAGWPLHPELPVVTRPESNAIGILTKATNLITRAGCLNLGEMLNKGPLNTVLKGDENHPSYRALVIDVGAYTTDFASLYINTSGKPYSPVMGAGFSVTAHSVPLGAIDLEASLPKVLSPDKREWLVKASRKEFSAFQRNVFSEGKGYRVPSLGVIGGEADREAIQTCLSEFGTRLADEVTRFCMALEPASMQELIITGGGSNIPAVRDALLAAAEKTPGRVVKTHAPDLKRGKAGSPPVDKLDEHFARGGSALGGASIYFERSYY